MAKKVPFTYKIYDNYIELIPDEGIKDNSIYEITLKNIRSKNKVLDKYKTKIVTNFSPCYCSLDSVMTLISGFGIDEVNVLYHIREASKYADYLIEQSSSGITVTDDDIPFSVDQFVKYKTALETLLKTYMDKVSSMGEKGKISDIEYDNNGKIDGINRLIDELKLTVKKWEQVLRGYDFAEKVKPKAVLRGKNPSETLDTFSNFTNGYDRGDKQLK